MEELDGILAGFEAARLQQQEREQQRLDDERQRHELFKSQQPVTIFEVDDSPEQFKDWTAALATWADLAVEAGKSGNIAREIAHFGQFENSECAATVAVLENATDPERVFAVLDRIRRQSASDAQKVRCCVSGAVVRVGNDFEKLVFPPPPADVPLDPAVIATVDANLEHAKSLATTNTTVRTMLTEATADDSEWTAPMTLAQLARKFGRHTRTIQRWFDKGDLPCRKVGSSFCIPLSRLPKN